MAPAVAPRAPGSVAYNPLRSLQGTAGHDTLEEQNAYNAQAMGIVKRKLNVPRQAFAAASEAYTIHPGDTAHTIAHKQRLLAKLSEMPDATIKSGAGDEAEGEGP